MYVQYLWHILLTTRYMVSMVPLGRIVFGLTGVDDGEASLWHFGHLHSVGGRDMLAGGR